MTIITKGMGAIVKHLGKKIKEFSYGPRQYGGSMPKIGGKQGVLFTEKTGVAKGTPRSKETSKKIAETVEIKKIKKQTLTALGRLGDRRYKITKGSRWDKDK